jgi:hypothetical protein
MRKSTLILTIFLLLAIVGAMALFYNWLREGCDDGRGTSYYFNKTSFSDVVDMYGWLPKSEKMIIAKVTYSCEIIDYQILINGNLRMTNSRRFEEFLNLSNSNCENCILEFKTGWPYMGRIYTYYPRKLVCEPIYGNENRTCYRTDGISELRNASEYPYKD